MLEQLACLYKVTLRAESKFNGNIARIKSSDMDTLLLFPTGFMNCSGLSVSKVLNFYKIQPEEVLIIHDEIDLNPGTVRLKKGGGHGGHNGLRSINDHLGNKNYHRLRLGVGHPGNKDIVANYVLSSASKDQKNKINSAIDSAMIDIDSIIQGDFQKAMNNIHQNN
jgi:PTH1 family peptidyl-tRNA hydrolase